MCCVCVSLGLARADGGVGEGVAGGRGWHRSKMAKERSREAEAKKRPLWDHASWVTVRVWACACVCTCVCV